MLTLPFSLQWRTTRRMGPSPSWTPLLTLRLMGNCLPLCTGNLPILPSTYSGTVTITSAKFSVIHTLSHRVQTVCSNPELLHKEKTNLRNALPNANTPNGLWTMWREGSTNLPVKLLMGLTTRVPHVPSLLPKKLKPKVTLL